MVETLAYRDILQKQTQNANQHSKTVSSLPTVSHRGYPDRILKSWFGFWGCHPAEVQGAGVC